MNYIGNKISKLRKQSGLTQQDLASKINYSDKVISKWERGESTPDIYALQTISDFFGIEIRELVDRNKNDQAQIEIVTKQSDWSKYKLPLVMLKIILLFIPLIFTVMNICIVADIYAPFVNGYYTIYDPVSIIPVVIMGILFLLTVLEFILTTLSQEKARSIVNIVIFSLITLLALFDCILFFIYGMLAINEISYNIIYMVIACIVCIVIDYVLTHKNTFSK